MESWSWIASEPYYFLHFLAFFSYIPVRSSASVVLAPYITEHLLYREIQAALAFLVLTAIKLFNFIFFLVSSDNGKGVRTETWEAFIGDTLFFGKAFLIVVSLIIDYHVALWYAMIFLVLFALADQPAHQGLGTSVKLTPLQLETLLTEGNTSKFWLVEFRAACSPHCTSASRCFTELSVTYSNKNLSFGIIDLGLFPNVAERFGISLGTNGQLPTYILFENATEIVRFPEIGFESKPSHPPITKRLLSQHFELDLLLLEYVNGK